MEDYSVVLARRAEYIQQCALPVKVSRFKAGVLQFERESSGEVVRVDLGSWYRPFTVRLETSADGSLWRLLGGEETVMEFAHHEHALQACREIAAYAEDSWEVEKLPADEGGDVVITGGHGEDVQIYRKATGETRVIGLRWKGTWETALKAHRSVGGVESWVLLVDGLATMRFSSRERGEFVVDKLTELRGFGGLFRGLNSEPMETPVRHVKNWKAPVAMVMFVILWMFMYGIGYRVGHKEGYGRATALVQVDPPSLGVAEAAVEPVPVPDTGQTAGREAVRR